MIDFSGGGGGGGVLTTVQVWTLFKFFKGL